MVKVRSVVYDEKPLQQAVSQETTIWALYERRDNGVGAFKLFNKIISELLAVDVKIDEEDKALILLSLFQSHMIISSPPYSTVKKLSSWRRSCQLSYLMRSGKGQIKRSRNDRVWLSRARF